MSSERAPRPSRNAPPPRARAAGSDRRRVRDDDLAYGHDSADYPRGADRRPGVPPRGSDRGRAFDVPRPAGARGRTMAEETGGRKLRGIVAVVGVFLLTLAGAAVDSFVGIGLGTITLITLVGSTVLATLLVRRRDLLSMVVAPPLVFTAVAAVNIALAPSASANLATIATLLVRGFPTMAIATVVALVLALVRWATRR
ncbi:MAG TPA: DUF6542 domain-containing protein [Blastococcus sp.]|nr:DUF6542 domain-containing protein [Blastococcus sp.]